MTGSSKALNERDAAIVARVQAGDRHAADELIRLYTPLVGGVVNRLHLSAVDQSSYADDLMQEGRIAIFKAAASYDPDRGAMVYSYLLQCVWHAIYRAVRNERTDAARRRSAIRSLCAAKPPCDRQPVGVPLAVTRLIPRLTAAQQDAINGTWADPSGGVGDLEFSRSRGMSVRRLWGLRRHGCIRLRQLANREGVTLGSD